MLKPNNAVSAVSISGAYWTGASAVIDLLAEHPSFVIIPGEFTLFSFGQFFQEVYTPLSKGQFPEGALKMHMRRMRDFDRSDLYPLRAIGRKLCRSFHVYPQLFFNHRTDAGKLLGEGYIKSRHELDILLSRVGDAHGDFDLGTLKVGLNTVLEQATLGRHALETRMPQKFGVFDQMVSPPYFGDAVSAFPNMKFINVDRDWRDQYVFIRPVLLEMMRRNYVLNIRPWNESFFPVQSDVKKVFLKLRQNVNYIIERQKKALNKNVLWLDLEDIVFKRDEIARRVFDFVGVDNNLWVPDQHLFPEQSAKRMGAWKTGVWQSGTLKNELDYLSEQLGKYKYAAPLELLEV